MPFFLVLCTDLFLVRTDFSTRKSVPVSGWYRFHSDSIVLLNHLSNQTRGKIVCLCVVVSIYMRVLFLNCSFVRMSLRMNFAVTNCK